MIKLELEPSDLAEYERITDTSLAEEFLKEGEKLILFTGGRDIYEVSNISDYLSQKRLYDMKVIQQLELYIE